MVANFNLIKTEKPFNDYKLFLKKLPKLNGQLVLGTFCTFFKNCKSKVPDSLKASYSLNCLDLEDVKKVMPSLPNWKWTYQDTKDAILSEFNNKEMLTIQEHQFMNIHFKLNESILNSVNNSTLRRGVSPVTKYLMTLTLA